MATVIKCKIDGMADDLELAGGLKFGYTAAAIVNNPTQKITFGPLESSSFIFSVAEPKADAAKALVKWLTDHEIKESVEFKISDQVMTAMPRSIKLEKVCLVAYDEVISETEFVITLEVLGQTVTVYGMVVE